MPNFFINGIKIIFGSIKRKRCETKPERSVILVNHSAVVLLYRHVYSFLFIVFFCNFHRGMISGMDERCTRHKWFGLEDSLATTALASNNNNNKKARGVCSVASLWLEGFAKAADAASQKQASLVWHLGSVILIYRENKRIQEECSRNYLLQTDWVHCWHKCQGANWHLLFSEAKKGL